MKNSGLWKRFFEPKKQIQKRGRVLRLESLEDRRLLATTSVGTWSELSAAVADTNCDDIVLLNDITLTNTDAPINIGSRSALTIRSDALYAIRATNDPVSTSSNYDYNAFNIDNVAVTFSNITLSDFHQTDVATINVSVNGGSYALNNTTLSNSVKDWSELGAAVNRGSNDIALTLNFYLYNTNSPIAINSTTSQTPVTIRSNVASNLRIDAGSYNSNAFNIDGVAVTFRNLTLSNFNQTNAATINVTGGGSYSLENTTLYNTVNSWDNLRNAVNRGSSDIAITQSFSVNPGEYYASLDGIEIGGNIYSTGKAAASAITIHSYGNNKYAITGTGDEYSTENAFTISGNNTVTLQNLKLADFSSETPTLYKKDGATGSFVTNTSVTQGYVTWNGLRNAIGNHEDASEFVLFGDMTTDGAPIVIEGSDIITIKSESAANPRTITGNGDIAADKNAFTIIGDKSAAFQNVVFKDFCSSTPTLYVAPGANGEFAQTNVVDGFGSWDTLRKAVDRKDDKITILNNINLADADLESPIVIGSNAAANIAIQSQSGKKYTIKGTGAEAADTNAFTITGANTVTLNNLFFSDFCSSTSTLNVTGTGSFTQNSVVDGFSSWDTLRKAINRRDSDIIILANITVTGSDDASAIEIGTNAASDLTIRSADGVATPYTITGTADANAFNISDGNTVTFRKITLTNFKSETPTINVTGTGAELNLTNMTISQSTGIYMGTGTTLTATGAKFISLTASAASPCNNNGGAIYSDGATINITGDGMEETAFTFKDCFAGIDVDTFTLGNGGAIYADGGTLNINNASIKGGAAGYEIHALYGGGIYVTKSVELTLTSVKFEELYADDKGGAVYFEDFGSPSNAATIDLNATITNCEFYRNTAEASESSGFGGAIYVGENNYVLIEGGKFDTNRAVLDIPEESGLGGAIYNAGNLYIKNHNEGTGNNQECYFDTNTGDSCGGAIYNVGFLQMEASSMYNNTTENQDDGVGGGAGIYNVGDLRIYNSLLIYNGHSGYTAYGGGIYSNNTGNANYSFLMVNCTVADNKVTDAGGGLYFDGDLDPDKNKIYNSLIVNNKTGSGVVDNINEIDPDVDIFYTIDTSISENVEIALLFVGEVSGDSDGRTESPKYKLLSSIPVSNVLNATKSDETETNPAINAGSNEYYESVKGAVLSPGDFLNSARFQAYSSVAAEDHYDDNVIMYAIVDIGAFEASPDLVEVTPVTDLASLKQAIIDTKYNYYLDYHQSTTINIPATLEDFDSTLELNSLAIVMGNDETSGEVGRIAVPLVLQFSDQTIVLRDGAGASVTARHFRIKADETINAPITIENVTLTGGSSANNGGSTFIEKDAELVLNDVHFTNNTAKNGGAINNYGTLTMNGGSFGDGTSANANSADRFGGAYFGCGAATFTGCAFANNTALTGGAVYSETNASLYADGADATFENCNFYGNSATGTVSANGLGNGGAIANFGTATINGGTFGDSTRSNVAVYHGGAVVNGLGATLNVNGATFVNNIAGKLDDSETTDADEATRGYGGAINNFGTLALTSAIFTNNTATQNGGAVASSGTLTFAGTDADAATSFSGNGAGYCGATASTSDIGIYGGAVVSTGALVFSAANKTTFNAGAANKISALASQGLGIDFANGNFGITVDGTRVVCDSNGNVYNYTYRVAAQQNSFVILETPPLANSSAVLYDVEGNGVYREAAFLDATNFNVGANVVKRRVVAADGSVSDSEITLTVVKIAPTVDVVAESLADGQILRLSLAVASPVAVSAWRIAWGDGTTDEYSNLATALVATHRYAQNAENAVYNVTLELVDVDGFGAGNVYELDSHCVAAAPVSLSILDADAPNTFEIADVEIVLPVLEAVANPLAVALPESANVGSAPAVPAARAVVFDDYADEESNEDFAFLTADQRDAQEKNRFDFDALETELDVSLQ